MPYLFRERTQPAAWRNFHPKPLHPYLLPLSYTNWAGEWMAYILGKWSIFEVLDYVGSFSILIAVIFYFTEAGDRLKMKHFQAWQVINTAQGKGGNGGRVDALEELNQDRVSLVGVDLSDASIEEVDLAGADLHRALFDSADLMRSVLRGADLRWSGFTFANLRGSDLSGSNLNDANLSDGDLVGVDLTGADLRNAVLDRANLREANFKDVRNWSAIKSIQMANVHGICNADDFVAWAKAHGAIDVPDDDTFDKQAAGAGAGGAKNGP